MIAATETTIVSHSRSPITSETGRRHSIAMPKLPRTTSVIQLEVLDVASAVEPVLDAQAPPPAARRAARGDIWAM